MSDTKTKILDAAEKLIVELGAEKASLRKITAEAGVNVAAINYHFGSKNNLVTAILLRFLEPLMDEVSRRMCGVIEEAGEGIPVLEDLLRSVLVALHGFSVKYPDHHNIFVQLALSYDDENMFRQNFQKAFGQHMLRHAGYLKRALPELPEQVVLMRMAFFRNTTLGIMEGDCMMMESMEVFGIEKNQEQMIDEMVAFAAAGFRAPV